MVEQPENVTADDFDLGAWIDGHHTYPEYTVKVYLDKAAVVASNRLISDVEDLQKELERLAESRKMFSKGSSLTDTPPDFARVPQIEQEIKAKRQERESILAKAKGSALKVTMRRPEVSDDDEGDSTNVFEKIRAELVEKYPEHAEALSSSDQEAARTLFQENSGLAHYQMVLLFHTMIAMVTTAKGVTIERGPKLTRETLSKLIKRMDVSDLNRLQMNSNQAMSGADLREDQIDAGFPG